MDMRLLAMPLHHTSVEHGFGSGGDAEIKAFDGHIRRCLLKCQHGSEHAGIALVHGLHLSKLRLSVQLSRLDSTLRPYVRMLTPVPK
jgi:hypothetical protein